MTDYSVTINQLRERLHKRKSDWWQWHKENPHVWELFEKYTFDANQLRTHFLLSLVYSK